MYKSLITAAELFSLLSKEKLTIIDCRFSLSEPDAGQLAYEKEHLPGAHYAHLDRDLSGTILQGKTGRHPFPPISELSEKCGNWGIDQHTQVVVYDQGNGGIAARLWFLLRWLGHEAVAVLNGGWNHWTARGFPVTAEKPVVEAKDFEPIENNEWLMSLERVEQIIGDPAFRLFDARVAERYRGEVEPIDPVAGHIPGAVSAPFSENMGTDGLFLSKEKLTGRFDKLLSGYPLKQSVFYCGSGVTACHNLLAMSYIDKEGAKLYPGSWSEWIAGNKRPVERG